MLADLCFRSLYCEHVLDVFKGDADFQRSRQFGYDRMCHRLACVRSPADDLCRGNRKVCIGVCLKPSAVVCSTTCSALQANPDFQQRFASLFEDSTILGVVFALCVAWNEMGYPNPTPALTGVCSFTLGAALGALFVSVVGNRFGRRQMAILGSIATLVFAALQASSILRRRQAVTDAEHRRARRTSACLSSCAS